MSEHAPDCTYAARGLTGISALLSPDPGGVTVAEVTCHGCGVPLGAVTMTPASQFNLAAATEDEVRRLSLYGACHMCGTPRDWRETRTGESIGLELTQPCGHPASTLFP